ncbi:uncharacterized protein LOC130513194 isoform X2 [Takifugu flavidus]|uniref:uncharacterized protein LOC130513194 isoform X2 n=1 Tax=Takifugu flavidus TaxID=433684 RepID=UPI0025448185|nr:uncharacterized protein LOC130513194 isoform X2 [Takifugu flavidus]
MTSSSSGNIPEVPADQNLHDNRVKAQHYCVCGSYVSISELWTRHTTLCFTLNLCFSFVYFWCDLLHVEVCVWKQCIESEKLFDFLKDLVDQATSTASKKDNRGVSVWPIYRPGRRETSVKKPVDEMAPRPRSDSLDNDNSSSEPELYICC